jgi:hypothetical protein
MANRNYRAGRRLEYECMRRWEEKTYHCMRTAGSHGLFDVIAIKAERRPEFIQCKRVTTLSAAKRLLKSFKEVTIPSLYYHQVMEVKVKGSKEILSVTV